MAPEREGLNMEQIAQQEAAERLPRGFKLAEVPREWGPPQLHKVGPDGREVLGYKVMDRGEEVVVECLEVTDEIIEQSQTLPSRKFNLNKGDRVDRWHGVRQEGPDKGKPFLSESVTQFGNEGRERTRTSSSGSWVGEHGTNLIVEKSVLIPAHFNLRDGYQESQWRETQRVSSNLDKETGKQVGESYERRSFYDKNGNLVRSLDRSLDSRGSPKESEEVYFPDRDRQIHVDENGNPTHTVASSEANFLDFLARRGYGGTDSFVDLESGESWQETVHHLNPATGKPFRFGESSLGGKVERRTKNEETLSPEELKNKREEARREIENLKRQIAY